MNMAAAQVNLHSSICESPCSTMHAKILILLCSMSKRMAKLSQRGVMETGDVTVNGA